MSCRQSPLSSTVFGSGEYRSGGEIIPPVDHPAGSPRQRRPGAGGREASALCRDPRSVVAVQLQVDHTGKISSIKSTRLGWTLTEQSFVRREHVTGPVSGRLDRGCFLRVRRCGISIRCDPKAPSRCTPTFVVANLDPSTSSSRECATWKIVQKHLLTQSCTSTACVCTAVGRCT
ncbi:hypothetical protein PGTUg99_016348 [Puccinia graminis f. sp. tritici]|uniref:Uncharacterized protein n=1 Tax=Puccinia graminis f. sp. tritici TaxID=56615 RepID=A0A5B0LL15_PUCGR|nr:hypothetical protein PGTUg99_016348 [Puccinia graminis f. sp. tritici]